MQSFHLSFCPVLFLSLLFLSSFHGQLVNGQKVFDFPATDKNSLFSLLHGQVDSSGTLTLDSTSGDAQAFYAKSISLGLPVRSFTSFFTFASNATSGNGTIAFVFTPDVTDNVAVLLTEARKTLTIEFNTSCSSAGFDGNFYGGHGFQGRGGGYGGRGMGSFGGFQVSEYANNNTISSLDVSGYGPNWNLSSHEDGPYFCSQDVQDPTFLYEVVVEYNASTSTLWVGSPSCGVAIARTTEFTSYDLSNVITKPVYAGFLVSGGGVFNITQWNFTNNVNTSSVTSLALSSVVDSPSSSSNGDGSNMDDGRGHSDGKLKKGYVIAFSVLGAAIGVVAVLLLCCLCVRRKRATSARFVAKSVHAGTIPESAVVFDAKKPPTLPAKVVLVERDTTPLYTHPNSASTGTASWLQPVAPR